MDEMMNYRQIRIDQMKEKESIKERNIWLDESLDGDSEYLILKMFDKIISIDKTNGIKPCDALPINLRISSYGGSAHTCFSIVDRIKALRKIKYKIHGYAYGKCMSSAFKIFICCSKRFAQPSCDFMCHMPNHGEYGGFFTAEDDKRRHLNSERLWQKARSIILEFTNIPKEMLDVAKDRNDDLYFWGEESIEKNLGIVDELF